MYRARIRSERRKKSSNAIGYERMGMISGRKDVKNYELLKVT